MNSGVSDFLGKRSTVSLSFASPGLFHGTTAGSSSSAFVAQNGFERSASHDQTELVDVERRL